MATSSKAETTRRLGALTFSAAATVLLAGAAGAANAPGGDIKAYKPIADAYVSSSQPRTNFGTAKFLRVDGAPETTAYLRFRVKKVQGTMDSATLLLRASTAARARFAVRPVDDLRWREGRMTFATAPDPSARYAASKPVRLGAWSAVDVTPFVDGDGGFVNLALTTRAPQGVAFWSRESSRGPRLVIRANGDEEELPRPSSVVSIVAE